MPPSLMMPWAVGIAGLYTPLSRWVNSTVRLYRPEASPRVTAYERLCLRCLVAAMPARAGMIA